mmetsp:Transcript_132385/g.264073  ORF Transcript_132385/g.264073 Transcript_132385/m.264073 type:complete len:224 (+) Transcript_132385:98-769(+)|eukprot:CAMPEP_0172842822 /NCGR_PEP_ID=MMETSP1075-20121228/31015_1 /TAXON_ID=2916 /ORGANISM="Ceratium fusus, Strain PA161109" /LENGTH=223 /DNA_ID=CAMNT_0013687007 /DNA_START=98 /DNA_END=769 /DNA_ORIENTATION=+
MVDAAKQHREAILHAKCKDSGLLGNLKKQMLGAELVKRQCLVREVLAFSGLGKVDCVMLRLPWGGGEGEDFPEEVRQLRSKGASVVLCSPSLDTEARAAAEQFCGSDAGVNVLSCPGGEDWVSVVSHVGEHATAGVLAAISMERIPQAIQALQNAGHIVLYYGFSDDEQIAVATAAIGVAAGIRGSDAIKEASSIIAIDDSLHCVNAALDAKRKNKEKNCIVQ